MLFLVVHPEWRNWQTRWTQNPVVLSTVWVRPPPPGPILSRPNPHSTVFRFSINKSDPSPLNRFNMLFAARPAGVRGHANYTVIPRRGFVPRSRRLPFWLILVFAAFFTVPNGFAAAGDGPANRTYLHQNWQIQSDRKSTRLNSSH